MEGMDTARRVGGVIWVVVGLVVLAGWMVTEPSPPPGPVTWVLTGILALGAAVQLRSVRPPWRWWAGRVIGIVIAVDLLGAVADRFGLLGSPGEPGVSWGDWAHFRAATAQLVPWSPLVEPAAVAATAAELVLGAALVAGLQWRWVGKVTAGLFTVYLVAMAAGTGIASVLQFNVPVLIGAALLTSARGARPPKSVRRGRRTRGMARVGPRPVEDVV